MKQQYHQSRLALGSDCTLCIVTDRPEAEVQQLFDRLWSTIFGFERQFSRFIPDSELSAFNRQAGLNVQISPEFRDILRAAKRLSELTDGLYNPFVLPALQRAGYTKSHVERYKDDEQANYQHRSVVAISKLQVDDTRATISYGTALDLGGCGKGYLADLLADTIVPTWVDGFWFSLGGDVVGQGHDVSGKVWDVQITDGRGQPTDQGWYIQTDGKRFAAATSGTAVRSGRHKGKRWHHIIDPRTLLPAISDCSLATVYGSSATETDVLASCAIILGSVQAQPFLKQHGTKAALLMGKAVQVQFGAALHSRAPKQAKLQGAGSV